MENNVEMLHPVMELMVLPGLTRSPCLLIFISWDLCTVDNDFLCLLFFSFFWHVIIDAHFVKAFECLVESLFYVNCLPLPALAVEISR